MQNLAQNLFFVPPPLRGTILYFTPPFAEGARGWVDLLFENFTLLIFCAFNPPPLSPSC
ncbi:hypothetical protein [Helicobacter sp. T3_23-1056]